MFDYMSTYAGVPWRPQRYADEYRRNGTKIPLQVSARRRLPKVKLIAYALSAFSLSTRVAWSMSPS